MLKRNRAGALALACFASCVLLPLGSPASEATVPAVSNVCGAKSAGRPAVGLALSGGGARGGAHIGVLKALEELRVPVDCIAGTSVGAVIGGFYAAGLSIAAIEAIASGIDWNAAFLDELPRGDRSFRRKNEDFLFFVDLRPGFRAGKIALPIGLAQGQVVDMIVARALANGPPVRDFDRLGTPFRAVATDIATGDAVVLGAGDLALALRASMSLPAVLAPVDIDGRMLIDGGLAMNLPVEVAAAMGADVVVAIDATSSLLAREYMHSLLDVTSQLTTLITQPSLQDQKRRLDADDILLTPSFPQGATFVSFATFNETIEDGYRAVMDARARFEPLSLDAESYASHVAARGGPRTAQPPEIGFVRLANRSSIADSIIAARLGGVELGKPLDLQAVEAAVRSIYGLGLFQNVRYEVVDEEDGATGLEIGVDERAWGPSYFEGSLHYASSSSADTNFTLAASYLRTGINAHGGEWRGTMALGDEPGLAANFHQPLGPEGAYFFESQLGLESTLMNVFAGSRVASSFDVREGLLELGAGRVLGSTAELRAGLRSGSGDYRLRVGDPQLLPGDEFRRAELFARISVDTLDSVAFPRAGVWSTIEWVGSHASRLSADADYDQLSVRAAAARTWKRHTVVGTLRYDATLSGTSPVHSAFRLGGFRDLSGLARNELSGQNAARVGLTYYREVGHFALFPAFVGLSLERGNVWEDRHAMSSRDMIAAASVWAGIVTPIGPVYLGAGRTEDGRRAVYLSLGGAF
jgi:NTE family protein